MKAVTDAGLEARRRPEVYVAPRSSGYVEFVFADQ